MEPAMRFELMTSSLPRRRSTPELRGRDIRQASQLARSLVQNLNQDKRQLVWYELGAGDEIRTRDPQLGRLMLYQLSYTRSRSEISNLKLETRKFHLVQGVGFEPT